MNAILPLLDDIRHKATIDEVLKLVEFGAFQDPSRIELIDGVIIEMPAEGFAHGDMKALICEWLTRSIDGAYRVIPDTTLVLSPTFAPSPDIRVQRRDVPFSQANGADVLLIVEIADTSLRADREVKAPLYAQHDIAEYWIIDLEGQQVLHHILEVGGTYGAPEICSADDTVWCRSLPGLAFKLSDFKLTG